MHVSASPNLRKTSTMKPSFVTTEWIRLVAYGSYPHPRGLQHVTQAVAHALAQNFHSLQGRLRRAFRGVPIYIGHPDDASFAGQDGHRDTRAYGWLEAMDARADGLWIKPRWSSEGRKLLTNAHYRFLSPRWLLKPATDGGFHPVRLLSIGLTNQPNIPGDAIANEERGDRKVTGSVLTSPEIETILANALAKGRLAPHERAAWTQRLYGDFPGTVNALRDRAEVLPLRPVANDLGKRQYCLASTQPFTEAVEARMQKHGENYVRAWAHTRRLRPDLYATLRA